MKIREATAEDLKTLFELSFEFLKNEAGLEPTYDPEYAKTEDSQNFIKLKIQSDDAIFLVAEDNGRLVGFLMGTIYPRPKARKSMKPAVLDEIFVSQGYRNKGVGKELIEKFQDWARGKGANKLRVSTHHKNEEAIKFYREFGFKDFYIKLEKDI